MKINVITLCSGYDSQCMALDKLKEQHPDFDYELIAWCEFDPESKQPIDNQPAVIAHKALYPQWADRNVGDMTKVDWSQFRGTKIDLLTYSTPCLTNDSLILTKDGYKELKDIKIGDLVLTKSGKFHPVAKKFDNGVHQTYYLNGMGFENIHCTENHKFLVRTRSRVWDNPNRRWKRVFSEPTFKEVKDITKDDFFGVPVINECALPSWNGTIDNRWGHGNIVNRLSDMFTLSPFWYIMGRYVGDGWTRSNDIHNEVIICCGGRKEEELVWAMEKCGFHYNKTVERTCNKYRINSKELVEFVDRYGHYAHGKRVDGETMCLPNNLLKAFIDGCMDSDGYLAEDIWKYSSVSRELIYSLSVCINKVYHRHCCIGKYHRKPTTIIEGRKVNQRDTFMLTFTKDARKQDRAFYEDGYIWYPFNSLVKAECENVYNMEIEEDHSYIVQGCISKNCTDISIAGLQKGLEEDSGTRSSILWYTRNAIKELHPKYLMLENVKALVGKKFFPYFQKWLDELRTMGYESYWRVCNGTEVNVPQNRERVFVISVRQDSFNEPPYKFPKPVDLTRTIEDILEDEVDERYYLKDEQVNLFLDRIQEGDAK